MPASSLTLGSQYFFLLSISENTVNLTTCSDNVEVVSTTPTYLNLTLVDDADSKSYLDPTIGHNLSCVQTQETKASLTFDWKIWRKSTLSYLTLTGNTYIQPNGNLLVLNKNALNTGEDYNITCKASNIKYQG